MDGRLDSREAWLIATAALVILSVTFGSPYVVIAGLKTIAADLGGQRSIPSAANSLAWLGTGVGGLAMGLIADRVGVRWTVAFGAVMVCAGLAVSSLGGTFNLWLGHGLLIGLLGAAGINAPLYVYVTRWFEKRRGTALALIASGQYVSGAFWPPFFEQAIERWGWQTTMRGFGLIVAAIVVPLALLFLKAPPITTVVQASPARGPEGHRVLGLPSNTTFALLAGASFLCCIPMSMPQAHLIAFCGDLGLAAGRGALMLSMLLTLAFLSRQFWGWMSDRLGALITLIVCSGAMAVSMTGFLIAQDEAGLFVASALFGLGFSGMIPAYVLAAREHFPAREASWRMPLLLLTGTTGMALGSWLAGKLYDGYGFYAPAFATGLTANLANFLILATLVILWRRSLRPAVAAPKPL